MKAILCLLSVSILSFQVVYGQDLKTDSTSNWKTKLAFGINFNQAAFSANWKGGGVTSLGLNAQLDGLAFYKKGKHSWENELDALFGFVYRENLGYQKTLDKIYLDSKYGYMLNKKWSAFVSLNFLTQFAEGYDNETPQRLVSELFAPAYITLALGAVYEPVDYFKLRIAPLAPRLTVVSNPVRFLESVSPTPYGVNPTENTRLELLAFQLLADFKKDLSENINLKWRYILFANYETLSLETLDHRIDLNLVAKINKFINVSLGGILIYDFDQDTEVQLSQLFTLGAAYTFRNFEEKPK